MKNISFALLFCLLVFSVSAQSPKSVYYVLSFGAKGNGNTSDTKAINRAIDSAAANGGGQVYFQAGNYLSGSIHLKSNISL
ncbi:MAG TPA: glycosyl hydrolase family 28-related protein, partial [Mucilaginibacter sp.]|nr:glycosyl hydrolase family 28-related protein [Mucilaginibacter sp.]